jgi:hypothetical protein
MITIYIVAASIIVVELIAILVLRSDRKHDKTIITALALQVNQREQGLTRVLKVVEDINSHQIGPVGASKSLEKIVHDSLKPL